MGRDRRGVSEESGDAGAREAAPSHIPVRYTLVAGVALLVSTLTLFPGFGLGTLLMPGFALFLSVR